MHHAGVLSPGGADRGGGARTHDLPVKSRMLYQLSYTPAVLEDRRASGGAEAPRPAPFHFAAAGASVKTSQSPRLRIDLGCSVSSDGTGIIDTTAMCPPGSRRLVRAAVPSP